MLKKLLHDESGYSALFAALMTIVIIAITGLVVDTSMMILKQVELDAATDAVAMSMILALDNEVYEDTGEILVDEEMAESLSEWYLEENMPDAKQLSTEVIKTIKIDGTINHKILIRTKYTYKPVFMSIFGIGEKVVYSSIHANFFEDPIVEEPIIEE